MPTVYLKRMLSPENILCELNPPSASTSGFSSEALLLFASLPRSNASKNP